MRYLFVPALLCLAMAGCTSSQPQGLVANAPAMETTLPPPAAPSFNAEGPAAPMPAYGQQPALPGQAPALATAPATTTSAAGFPSPPACATGAGCLSAAPLEKCRTVGSVTTCDVPPDPTADDTHYTN